MSNPLTSTKKIQPKGQGFFLCTPRISVIYTVKVRDKSTLHDEIQSCQGLYHDILMTRVGRKVQEKRVLKIIRAYLNAGDMENRCARRQKKEGCKAGRSVRSWRTFSWKWFYRIQMWQGTQRKISALSPTKGKINES